MVSPPFDDPHDLVARGDEGVPGIEVSFGQVEIRTTHPAHQHSQSKLPPARNGDGFLGEPKRPCVDRPGNVHDPGGHLLGCHRRLPGGRVTTQLSSEKYRTGTVPMVSRDRGLMGAPTVV
jgi:hypothetical protein